jgi:hypothetical protein
MPSLHPDARAEALYEQLQEYGYACQIAFGRYTSLELCMFCTDLGLNTETEIRKHLFERGEGAVAVLENVGFEVLDYQLTCTAVPIEGKLRLMLGEKK